MIVYCIVVRKFYIIKIILLYPNDKITRKKINILQIILTIIRRRRSEYTPNPSNLFAYTRLV